MAGKVRLIDPNNSNLNYSGEGDNKEFQHNGIPQYQDMYISVELMAIERGRTILTSSLDDPDITKIHPKSFGKNQTISFLGENQDSNNEAHFGSFTTNWYDGSSEENKTYEGFGINSIDIVMNSSYIPQINIEFIDIRGLAFFNRKNSPYRVLFNFPPPIFYLTIKGYYGKPITYQMHLVKYNSEFKAETGNYHINANFIAITYAPLTDIPFRYIIQSPFMGDNPESVTSDTSKKPNNTLDLIIKLENVYSQTLDRIKTDPENLKYENSQKKVELYDNYFEKLRGYLTRKPLINGGTPQIFTLNKSRNNEGVDIQIINGFAEYNEYIKSFSSKDISSVIPKELHIGFKLDDVGSNFEVVIDKTRFYTILTSFKDQILADAKNISLGITNSDITDGDIKFIFGDEDYEGNITKYISINLTRYYNKLYKGRNKALNEKINSMNNLNEKINAAIEEKLGMLPTIYNIFEILMNDVDKFFNIMRKTSIDGENHHNNDENRKLIVNDGTYKDIKNLQNPNESKIYSFPLVIQQSKVCNQIVEERKAPFEISARCNTPFPELNLVQSFIDSFIKYNKLFQQLTLKEEKTANGNSIWIPFTPADSNFISNVLQTPYLGTDSFDVDNEPINLVETNKLDQIFSVLIKRFHLLCQNAIPYSFFDLENNSILSDAYINLYAKSEAINLSNSIVNENYVALLKQFALYNKNTTQSLYNPNNGFFSYIEKNLSDIYNQSPDAYAFNLGEDLHRDKTSILFKGIDIKSMRDISVRTGGQEGDVAEFIEDESEIWLEKIFERNNDNLYETYDYTTENLVFRGDRFDNLYQTKFLSNNITHNKFLIKTYKSYFVDSANYSYEVEYGTDEIRFRKYDDYQYQAIGSVVVNVGGETQKRDYPNVYKDILNQGNQYFQNKKMYDQKVLNKPSDISLIDAFSFGLLETGKIGYDVLFDNNSDNFDVDLSQTVILSAFGRVLSPFNYYPRSLNSDFFRTPSIVETPNIVLAYLGFLTTIKSGSTTYNKIVNFFENGVGSDIRNKGLFIFADIYDVNLYLGERDRTLLFEYYSAWYSREFPNILAVLKEAYLEVSPKLVDIFNSENKNLEKRTRKNRTINFNDYSASVKSIYSEQVSEIKSTLSSEDYNEVFENLMDRKALVVYNEIAFKYVYTINPQNYLSFNDLISTTDIARNEYGNSRVKVEKFFKEFFVELHKNLKDREEELIEERREFNKKTGDDDISTKTYYSFKNIHDKWLTGLNKGVDGYPFKTNPRKGLISQFAFVDRAMNPIGDTIIDTKILVDAKDDPNISIFTVISQLLSLNGFEFFPLQNFLSFENSNWEESFKIDTSGVPKQYPVFVCMYIGGASSYPTGIKGFSDFEDDGITDLENPNVGDFLNSDCGTINTELDRQMDDKEVKGDLYSQVRAFRVRYGEQNQNFFYNFGVDSKEYPETNESIQILSRLAGDEGKNAPVPKAQNLYDLYENRSYKATITGLGNAMIQPTQYFQLENVPLYNGAYVILDVNHNITANKMTTKFSGTKLLKYPMPRVLNAATIVNFDGGSTSETSSYEVSDNEITQGIGTAANPTQSKYLSMYEQKIGR